MLHTESPHISRLSQRSLVEDISKQITGHHIQECIMKRERRGIFGHYYYSLLDQDNRTILSAKTNSSLLSTRLLIYEPIAGTLIGRIKSDIKSISYEVSGPEVFYRIEYIENFLGRHGPRNFKLFFREHMFQEKPPLVVNGEYFQDFHDMKLIPSIKNFVCVDSENFSKEVCLFVKSEKDIFILRVMEPFSLFIGFTLALTALHTGIYHR